MHCIALLNDKQTFLDHILPLPAEKMAVLVDYCPTLRNTLDKSSLSCHDDADQRDQVAAWEAKWAFLALFMRSSGNSPFFGAIIRFFMLLHSLLQRNFNTARCLLVYLHLYIVGEWECFPGIWQKFRSILPHCGISQRVDIALQNVCTLSSPGCLCATLHFRKCSQPSIKLTGTPRPCHVGNLIPLHQRLTSRAPPSDTGPTSPIIKPTLVQPTPIVTPCPSVAQFDVIFHTDMVVWRR